MYKIHIHNIKEKRNNAKGVRKCPVAEEMTNIWNSPDSKIHGTDGKEIYHLVHN